MLTEDIKMTEKTYIQKPIVFIIKTAYKENVLSLSIPLDVFDDH